jgi:hypothetical protein
MCVCVCVCVFYPRHWAFAGQCSVGTQQHITQTQNIEPTTHVLTCELYPLLALQGTEYEKKKNIKHAIGEHSAYAEAHTSTCTVAN